VLLVVAISAIPVQASSNWINGGEYRITCYCEYCNEPEGHESASGQYLEYGQVAMNNVPFGTKVAIDGEIFTVTDRVGVPGTIDIFIPSDKGHCRCDILDYKNVYIHEGN
jgi:hypothetical protein